VVAKKRLMATLLVIDDDVYFRRVATTCLHPRHEVLQVSSLKDAETLLRDRIANLLIVDGLLPDGDGQTWIERFRVRDTKTPILFISAYWKNHLALARLPRTGTLHKPVLPVDLVMKVESALRAVGAESTLSAQAQGELEALRQAYTAELPQQLAGIAFVVHQLRAAPSNATLRGVLRRRAHRIAGIAGSFGYDDIGDACARIEQGVALLAQDERSGWREIGEAISRIAAFTSCRVAV
jgi:DNA-binding response OmpR family regulator